jgi:hypothetical protein
MKKIMRLALISDDAEYAAAFTEAVAATQRDFAVSVTGGGSARPGALGDDVRIVDVARPGRGDCVRDALRDPDASSRVDADVLEIAAEGGGAAVSVDKYAGCARICAEARSAYAASRGLVDLAPGGNVCGRAALVSFVGVDGGAGASSLALGFADELSAYRGKKTLYLSLEAFESPFLGAGGRMVSRGDMSGFLFAFFRSGADEGVSVGPYLSHDDYGVMRFPPSCGLNRLRELDGAELGRFLSSVAGEAAPDFVVLDWGSGLWGAASEYVKASAFTVLVARRGGVKAGVEGDDALLSVVDELGIDRARAVIAMGRAPAASGEEKTPDTAGPETDASVNGIAGRVEICDDPYAFDRDAGRVSISLATSFGTGVKRLVDVVLGADEDVPEANGGLQTVDDGTLSVDADTGEIL